MIIKNIEILENLILQIKPDIFKYYYKGISKKKILDFFSMLNIVPHKDLISLYKWRNGYKSNFEMEGAIFSEGTFLSIEQSIELYKAYIDEEIISKYYFPILSECYLFICLEPSSKDYGALFILEPDYFAELELKRAFLSLESFIEFHILGYKRKILWFDIEGKLRINFEKLFSLGREINPQCEYWIEE